MRIPYAASLAFAVAACGGNGPAPNTAADRAAPVNQAATAQATGARIAALPEPAREAVFYRAIHDAGMDCQDVTTSAPGGQYHGMPVWNATCRGGGHWTLVIGNDETVQVLNANEARLVTDQPAAAAANAAGR